MPKLIRIPAPSAAEQNELDREAAITNATFALEIAAARLRGAVKSFTHNVSGDKPTGEAVAFLGLAPAVCLGLNAATCALRMTERVFLFAVRCALAAYVFAARRGR